MFRMINITICNSLVISKIYKVSLFQTKHERKRNKMDWKTFIDKRVFIRLSDGGVYTGTIVDIDTSTNPILITIIDKFNKRVMISSDHIIKMEEKD